MRKKLLTRIHILGHPVPCFLKMEENWLFLFGNLFFLAFLLSVDCLCLTVSTSSELSKKGWSDKKRSRYCTTVPCITFKAPSSKRAYMLKWKKLMNGYTLQVNMWAACWAWGWTNIEGSDSVTLQQCLLSFICDDCSIVSFIFRDKSKKACLEEVSPVSARESRHARAPDLPSQHTRHHILLPCCLLSTISRAPSLLFSDPSHLVSHWAPMFIPRQTKRRLVQGKAYLIHQLIPKKCIYLCCSSKIADSAGASQGQVLHQFAETAVTLFQLSIPHPAKMKKKT